MLGRRASTALRAGLAGSRCRLGQRVFCSSSSTELSGSTMTSATVCASAYGLNPNPEVRLDCGSMSMASTRRPRSANTAASEAHVVVLPTPPFPETQAIETVMGTSVHGLGDVSEPAQATREHRRAGEFPHAIQPALHGHLQDRPTDYRHQQPHR